MDPDNALGTRTISIEVGAEIERYFDDTSRSNESGPHFVLLMGGVATGKTTLRRQRYSKGYVVVDAAEIFGRFSQGAYLPFPDALQDPMEIIGSRVAKQAVHERRHIVTEIIGATVEPVKYLIDTMKNAGYEVDVQVVFCDLQESILRGANRGDSISAYYAEAYNNRWLLIAVQDQS
jgi:hypothetical protein